MSRSRADAGGSGSALGILKCWPGCCSSVRREWHDLHLDPALDEI